MRSAEVIVLDQTARERRRDDLAERFPDLPLKVFPLDVAWPVFLAGTSACARAARSTSCSSTTTMRSRLTSSSCTFAAWSTISADVSSGVTREADGTPLPDDFKLFRASDVFPPITRWSGTRPLRHPGYSTWPMTEGNEPMVTLVSGLSVRPPDGAQPGDRRAPPPRSLRGPAVLQGKEGYLRQQHELARPAASAEPDRDLLDAPPFHAGRAGRRCCSGSTRRSASGVARSDAPEAGCRHGELPSTLWRVWKNYRRAVAMTRGVPEDREPVPGPGGRARPDGGTRLGLDTPRGPE